MGREDLAEIDGRGADTAYHRRDEARRIDGKPDPEGDKCDKPCNRETGQHGLSGFELIFETVHMRHI